jgi:hypothetical protein
MAGPAAGPRKPGGLHRCPHDQDQRRGCCQPAVYLAIGIDRDGAKQVLGLWVGPTTGESAKFCLSVLSELKSRGVAVLSGRPDKDNNATERTIRSPVVTRKNAGGSRNGDTPRTPP